MSWLRRLTNTMRPGRHWRELDREIAFHVAERAEQLQHEGLSEEEAQRRARLQFGNPLVQAENTRDVDVALWLDSLSRNVRYAVRALLRTPGFTITVVVTLALGIGANSAVFSMLDAVLLRPLPFPNADRLVHISQTHDCGSKTGTAAAQHSRRLPGTWSRTSRIRPGLKRNGFAGRLSRRASCRCGV
jgi:putative ABC transport system permease protein